MIWKWLGENDKQLIVCFALIGGLYALVQYWQSVADAQEQAVARYVELFSAPHVMKSRLDIEVFENSEEASNLKTATYDGAVAAKKSDTNFLSAILTQLNFFDSLSLCVTGGRCAQKSACDYFFNDAEAFIHNARPILSRLDPRSDRSSDAYLQDFVQRSCRSEFKAYCTSVKTSPDCKGK